MNDAEGFVHFVVADETFILRYAFCWLVGWSVEEDGVLLTGSSFIKWDGKHTGIEVQTTEKTFRTGKERETGKKNS